MTKQLSEGAQFIVEHRAKGISDAQIREHFAAYGWNDDHLAAIFAEAETSTHAQPQKYTIRHALVDIYVSVRRNWRAFTATLAISYGVLLAGFIVVSLLFAGLVTSDHHPAGIGFVIGFVFWLFLVISWYALGSAFLMATSAKALQDGFNGHHSDTRQLLQRSLEIVPRAAFANAVGAVITFGPVLIFVPLSIYLSVSASHSASDNLALVVLVIGIIGAITFAWLLIASLRFALIQQVAAFEPHLSVKQVLARSPYLLRSGGQWFVFKGFVILAILSLPFSNLNDSNHHSTFLAGIVDIFTLVLGLVGLCALTMLYFNRAAVRGSDQQS